MNIKKFILSIIVLSVVFVSAAHGQGVLYKATVPNFYPKKLDSRIWVDTTTGYKYVYVGGGTKTWFLTTQVRQSAAPTIVSGTPPVSLVKTTWFDTDDATTYVVNAAGNAWVTIAVSGGGGVSNLSYTASTGVVTNSNGTGFTVPLADGTNRGLLSSTDYTNIQNLPTLHGVSGGAANLGTFTVGSVYGTNYAGGNTQSIKQAFQAFITAVDNKNTVISWQKNGSSIAGIGGGEANTFDITEGSNITVTPTVTGTGTSKKISYSIAASGGGSGLALSEYGGSVTSSAGMTFRTIGTSGITVTKTNASTTTINVPASGWLTSAEIAIPSGENPGATYTIVINYASNTTFNQGATTAKIPQISAFTTGSLPSAIVTARNVPGAADMKVEVASVASGVLTLTVTLPSVLQSGSTLYKVNF